MLLLLTSLASSLQLCQALFHLGTQESGRQLAAQDFFSSVLESHDNDAVEDEGHIPTEKGAFERLWREKSLLEPPRDFPPKVQLVLGVFAYQNLKDGDTVRGVIRDSWMQQPGVCWVQLGQKSNCTVYTAFVLGSRLPAESMVEEVVLNIQENMNFGKTYQFFHYAASHYPWATHIGKMDLDTFPFLHRLTWSLYRHMDSGCEHFVGAAMDFTRCGKNRAWCPPKECGSPVGGNFLEFNTTIDQTKCWSYMQGGLYLMSMPLATNVSAAHSAWKWHQVGFEDLVTGKMVTYYGRKHSLCIRSWNPLAWDHVNDKEKADPSHSVSRNWTAEDGIF